MDIRTCGMKIEERSNNLPHKRDSEYLPKLDACRPQFPAY